MASQSRYYRWLTLTSGLVYLGWWFVVKGLLPSAFNPFPSRVGVVCFCFAVFAASFFLDHVWRHMQRWFTACAWLVTLHYFYLFDRNVADLNWVVGSYILVIALGACLTSAASLAAYAGFVGALSVAIAVRDQALLQTVFVPGLATILLFSYLGLRARINLTRQGRDQADRIQKLFDAVFEGVVIVDQGRVVDANDSFARMFGYPREEVLGRQATDFVTPEHRPIVRGQIEAMSEIPYEATGLRKDGSFMPIEILGKSYSAGGKKLRLTAINDITERKKSEDSRVLYEATREALRIRDEFISIASHELKTPLTSLKIQTQFAKLSLARGDPAVFSPARVGKLVEQADKQTDRLTKLVDDMLDISRISSGRLRMDMSPVSLPELVREAMAALSELTTQRGCPIEFAADGEIVMRVDRFRMEQVILNLLTNAMKYGEGRPISIAIRTVGQEVRLVVADQGIGIASEDHARIFQRFERAVLAKNISGLGLGLFICKEIVEAHQGRIEVDSAPGEGARFTVVLPREAGERAPP